VNFAGPNSISFGRVPQQQPVTVSVPAGSFVMIGNPYPTTATVRGADVVYTYTPGSGYAATTSLPAGQGAWVYSAGGGEIRIGTP